MDQIKKFRSAFDKQLQRVKKITNLKASEVAERSELEEIFKDAVEKVKVQIFKRKYQSPFQKQDSQIGIEESLVKLDEFGKNKISELDFTNSDKHNLLEIFLLHNTTLTSLYKQIFNKKENSPLRVLGS